MSSRKVEREYFKIPGASGLAATFLLALPLAAAADYRPLRFDEDWGKICNDVGPKCWRIAEDSTLTLGADARVRSINYWPDKFGIGSSDNSYVLYRALAHGDLRIGTHLQVFSQLGMHDETGRNGGAAPTDRSGPDLQQAFVGWNGGSASIRVGRQEMTLGSSRLIAVREGPNIRLAFDGARATLVNGNNRVDAFAFHPVQNKHGAFDDDSNREQSLWGAYATLAPVRFEPVKADVYWIGYQRRVARFGTAQGPEHRQSFGTRIFGAKSSWDWNTEAVFQTGRFRDQEIQAWTVSSDTGYTFLTNAWTPRLSLKADLASGDSNPADNRLGTFNALYPNPAYLSEATLLAPANLMDLQPALTVKPNAALGLTLGWDFIWKHRQADAIYTTPSPLIPVPGTVGTSRYIGDQIKLEAALRLDPQWELRVQAVHFQAGEGLREAGGHNVNYFSTALAFRW